MRSLLFDVAEFVAREVVLEYVCATRAILKAEPVSARRKLVVVVFWLAHCCTVGRPGKGRQKRGDGQSRKRGRTVLLHTVHRPFCASRGSWLPSQNEQCLEHIEQFIIAWAQGCALRVHTAESVHGVARPNSANAPPPPQ